MPDFDSRDKCCRAYMLVSLTICICITQLRKIIYVFSFFRQWVFCSHMLTEDNNFMRKNKFIRIWYCPQTGHFNEQYHRPTLLNYLRLFKISESWLILSILSPLFIFLETPVWKFVCPTVLTFQCVDLNLYLYATGQANVFFFNNVKKLWLLTLILWQMEEISVVTS